MRDPVTDRRRGRRQSVRAVEHRCRQTAGEDELRWNSVEHALPLAFVCFEKYFSRLRAVGSLGICDEAGYVVGGYALGDRVRSVRSENGEHLPAKAWRVSLDFQG